MNRPNRKLTRKCGMYRNKIYKAKKFYIPYTRASKQYEELNTYCDELENNFNNLFTSYSNAMEDLNRKWEHEERIEKLEKSLNKACLMLEKKSRENYEAWGFDDGKCTNRKAWKEWCMEDE